MHLVIARFRYDVEVIANQLKGVATKQLRKDKLDPMTAFPGPKGKTRSPWARGQWCQFLDHERTIEESLDYVEDNPRKEGTPRQQWSFVSPFTGIERGGLISYPF